MVRFNIKQLIKNYFIALVVSEQIKIPSSLEKERKRVEEKIKTRRRREDERRRG